MSGMDVIMALGDGNPGAISVLAEIFKNAAAIDPDSALGPLGALCGLDNMDCYGPRIWMLYKGVCGQDLVKMIGVLRACQLGIVDQRTLNEAIDGKRDAIDPADLLAKVRERLPKFGAAETVP
jgi:hypothetical protein